MDRVSPHAYYPRPSLERESFLCLNGEWDFAITDSPDTSSYNEKILVPFPPESSLSGIGRTPRRGEYLHYRRNITLNEDFKNDRIILHFGAVDGECEIYIDGKRLAEVSLGILPISLDVTDSLAGGEATLEVMVYDALDKSLPYGKQRRRRGGMWYTPHSGIWQSVWLESVPEEYIRELKITPTQNSVTVAIQGGKEHKMLMLDSGEVYEFDGNICKIEPKEIHEWSPECPYLYYFTLECGRDRVRSYFALREVGVGITDGKPHITLNGKPYLFNGLLDQGYYSDGLVLPASADAYLDDITLAKSLGFNMLRKHIKIEPEIFYYLCDREGIAVFQDMVNNGSYSFIRDTALPTLGLQRLPDAFIPRKRITREVFKAAMTATASHLYNHPSIVYYTIFNEGWGQFSADKMYELLKSYDKTRIIDATSGWFRQKKSDVDSRHIYFKRLRIKRQNGRPAVLSEFGGYSYRVPGHTATDKNYGYRLYKTREEFECGFYRLYEDEVAPLIKEGVSALVYTQLSDVEDETNGLITYDRECVKLDASRCAEVMKKIKEGFLN